MIFKKILSKLKDSGLAIYSFFGIIFAVAYLWISHKLKKLHEAKELLRVKDVIIDQQDLIIKDQKQQAEKVEDVKEFYKNIRSNMHDFTE